MDANNSFCHTDESQCCVLAKLFHKYSYGRGGKMIIVYLLTIISPEGAIYTTMVHTVNGMKMLKDCYGMVMLYGRHQCRSFEMLRNNYV